MRIRVENRATLALCLSRITHPQNLTSNEVKVVEVLSSFYDHQDQKSEEQLSYSLKSNGQLLPLTVSAKNELIDGYRRLNLLRGLGVKSVKVQIIDEEPTLDLRVALNTTRIKNGKRPN